MDFPALSNVREEERNNRSGSTEQRRDQFETDFLNTS